jgi:predicted ABC-type transport system involved in lysophospholipase L1 biosynthesis ATPase subunit
MTGGPPLIEITGLIKNYQGLRPLRVAQLRLERGDRCAIAGLDAGAAEAFVHLVTGAMVPDEGDVAIAGQSTRAIATDTDWLASLDRFGIVTARALLLDGLAVLANLALPLTLSVDPVPESIVGRVQALAADAGLRPERLAAAAATLSPEERVRVHLARALALDPQVLILEHPTAFVGADEAIRLGETLGRLYAGRGLGWIALTEDDRFARAAGGTRLRLQPATGQLRRDRFWRRFVKAEGV